MKRILFQAIFLIGISFVIGVGINFWHPEGIHPTLILASLNKRSPWYRIPPDSAFTLYAKNQAIFLDIRPRKEYQIDHLPNAHSVPFFEFFRSIKKFKENYPKERIYVLYGDESTTHQARLMISQLHRLGYTQVATMYGGFPLWLEMGYPGEKGNP